MPKTISTQALASLTGRPDTALLDLRPTAGFNGWPLRGEVRGGHIPGALSFPEHWLRDLDPGGLSDNLQFTGIGLDSTVVLYGDAGSDYASLLEKLESAGWKDVYQYQEGIQAWAADDALPMSRLPRFEKLVYPGWLKRLLDGEKPETFNGEKFLLFHVNFGARWAYDENHLPGAVYLDTNLLESEKDWNRRSPDELETAIASLGITADTTVILYGRHSRPTMADDHPGRKAGQIAATRAALILMYAGVRDVRLLDGGYDAWVDAGYPVESTPNDPRPVPGTGLAIPEYPQYIADLEEAKELIARDDAELVSIRSWNEFIGDTSGYHYIGIAGRIPGAVWGNCGTDAYHMQNYRNRDNGMRNYEEIAANWEAAGIRADKRIAFYCGTGWRASETFFYAYLMGWDNAAVYDGGWFEWSGDANNPIETGIPEAGMVGVF